MNFSHPIIDTISVVFGLLLFLVFPLWLVRSIGRKAEAKMPPVKSVAGVVVRVVLVLILVGGFFCSMAFGLLYWPPPALTQLKLRAVLAERLQKSGGWETVTKDCDQIMQRTDFHAYRWVSRLPRHPQFVGPPDPLPAGLAMLEPRSVHIERHGSNQWAVKVSLHQDALRHRFGILIICNAPTNAPALRNGEFVRVTPKGRQLADRVYEF